MAARLTAHKFSVLNNPHGILFNPLSVADALDSYATGRRYSVTDLFFLNDVWSSWAHHSRFSHPVKEAALSGINASQALAHDFVRTTDWVFVTLGTAFQYFLKDEGRPVGNNHRAPAQWFEKRLLDIDVIVDTWTATLDGLRCINPNVRVLFTVSPVRHIRDGAVANNRSKGRLLEAVHTLVERHDRVHYFPAYELVIDVLRDYRFYDLDLVHPNYAATEAVWEEFVKACIAPDAWPVMEAVRDITTAAAHRPRFPDTEAHQKFKASYAGKVKTLMGRYPSLDLGDELGYFETP